MDEHIQQDPAPAPEETPYELELTEAQLREASEHDLTLRTRRAELLAQRAITDATKALQDLQIAATRQLSRDDFDAKVAEWSNWRRKEQQQARLLTAVCVIGLLMLTGIGAYAYRGYENDQRYNTRRMDVVVQQFLTSCDTRNAQLDEQRRVYGEFIAIEQSDTAQDPGVREQKIRTYTDALAGLPQAVDCTSLRAVTSMR